MQLKSDNDILDSYNESLRHNLENCRSKLIAGETKDHLVAKKSDRDFLCSDFKKLESESKGTRIQESTTKIQKVIVKVAEAQTQTANDMATQTDINYRKSSIETKNIEDHSILSRTMQTSSDTNGIPQSSFNSEDKYESIDQFEDSIPNKMRSVSEISLHETTSSIKTETGTEISISTRGVTCSFNKFLDLEVSKFSILFINYLIRFKIRNNLGFF